MRHHFFVGQSATSIRWLTTAALAFASFASFAGTRESAARLYTRLAGISPTKAKLDEVERLIVQNDWIRAAGVAMAEPSFYNVTLKNWISPWTGQDRSMNQPLNDMSATVIGVIRDEDQKGAIPFDEILSADVLYVPGQPAIDATGLGYKRDDNRPYAQIENQRLNLKDPTVLVKSTQSAVYGAAVDSSGIAGLMSTRQWAVQYYSAGTNRRSFRFAAINFLCRDFEDMFDTSISDEYVTRDVDRAPGGDPKLYQTRCIGCHAGVNDPFRKAFAFYDYSGLGNNMGQGLVYSPGNVPGKINDSQRKAVPYFYANDKVYDDRWVNLITVGVNKQIGWNQPKGGGSITGGQGAASLGRLITATDAFAKCISRQVFDRVCIRKPTQAEVETLDGAVATSFRQSSYKVKPVFARVASMCLGDQP